MSTAALWLAVTDTRSTEQLKKESTEQAGNGYRDSLLERMGDCARAFPDRNVMRGLMNGEGAKQGLQEYGPTPNQFQHSK